MSNVKVYRPKFRCYHSEHGMMKVDELMDGAPSIVIDRRGNQMLWDQLQRGKMELSQWSSLTDMAGRDIYEGDVIMYKGAYRTGQTGTVVFEQGCFLVKHQEPNEQGQFLDMLFGIRDQAEIVGTKWDNQA